MLRLISWIMSSRLLKILFRIIASLASAILVISGYLFFVSVSDKNKQDDDTEEETEEDPSGEEDVD